MPINKALAEYLDLYHKGEANAVTSRELECAFRMRGSELRREINALRGDGIPICSFDGGYYYAATEAAAHHPAAPQPDQENRICGARPVPHLA